MAAQRNEPGRGDRQSLTPANVEPAQAGSYVLVITNVVGSVTSSAASLTVVPTGAILSISLSAGTGVSISFPSQAGLNYVLEYKSTLMIQPGRS